jgi:positive regulator of sigma E activity
MATPWFHSNGPLWMTAIVAGLIVTMLVAVLSPRLFAEEGPGWFVSLLGGVLVAAGIIVWGYSRRHSGEEEEHPSAQ